MKYRIKLTAGPVVGISDSLQECWIYESLFQCVYVCVFFCDSLVKNRTNFQQKCKFIKRELFYVFFYMFLYVFYIISNVLFDMGDESSPIPFHRKLSVSFFFYLFMPRTSLNAWNFSDNAIYLQYPSINLLNEIYALSMFFFVGLTAHHTICHIVPLY